MEDDLEEIVKKDVLDYLKNKLVLPVVNELLKYNDERNYKIFTEELADIFEEYQPDYFENDYHSRIGQYYFSSLYGDYVPEEMLIEIIKAQDDQRFNGIEVLFAGFAQLDYSSQESVNEMTIKFNHTANLIRRMILHHLNEKNVNT
jgi:hypothetical protein